MKLLGLKITQHYVYLVDVDWYRYWFINRCKWSSGPRHWRDHVSGSGNGFPCTGNFIDKLTCNMWIYSYHYAYKILFGFAGKHTGRFAGEAYRCSSGFAYRALLGYSSESGGRLIVVLTPWNPSEITIKLHICSVTQSVFGGSLEYSLPQFFISSSSFLIPFFFVSIVKKKLVCYLIYIYISLQCVTSCLITESQMSRAGMACLAKVKQTKA